MKWSPKKINWKSTVLVLAILILSFFMGRGIAVQQEKLTGANVLSKEDNWGLGFKQSGSQQQPSGTESAETLKKYDAYYIGNSTDKAIYLTFDCGFENGNTPAILDALKKHNAQATFFVVGHFLEENPELVKRMVDENHTVGNHTYHHPNVTSMGETEFSKEIKSVEDKYKEITGQEMTKYYRAPQGKFNVSNLQMAQAMGYKTFFWSLAYVDWYEDKQPTHEEAFNKLIGRIHPGAIVLLHNTSKTNGEILDELLTKWEDMGYTFAPLSNLVE
jgi:peptidoglycan-N-acetylmuramic acid deacetylase